MPKTKVFISYSSKDRFVAETIHRNLEGAGFAVWRDQTRLETDWSREIALALAENDLLCLLWSENSLISKWVKHEWLTARALEKRIIPCLFPMAPDLPEPLHNVHGVSFATMNEGCSALKKRISDAEIFFEQYDYTTLPRNSYIPFNPNPHFTGRHADLLELYLKMIGNLNKIGINQVGTVGMGGIGKTQLAVEFAHRFSFGFHEVCWIQAENPDDWVREFVTIARDWVQLKIEDPDGPGAERRFLFALQKHFKEHPYTLVIMDNVVEPGKLNNDSYLFGLTPLTLGCDLLFTTRKHFRLSGVSSQQVDVLSPDAAYELLRSYRLPKTPEEEESARLICNAVGYLPLAITLVGAYFAKYQDYSFADYHEELTEKRLHVIDIGKMSEEDLATRHVAAVTATLEDHLNMLKDEDARYLFLLAGQFPEAAIIPKARLGLLAGIRPGPSKIDRPLVKAFHLLHELCLVEQLESDASDARLHPLVREFSFQLVPQGERSSFRKSAAIHLKDAYCEYPRLEAELQTRGVHQVIEDLQIGSDWSGEKGNQKEEIELIHGTLRLSSHVLSHDQGQLAEQLLGRLMEEESPAIKSLLSQAKAGRHGPWLRPLTASLMPPGGPLIRTLVGHAGEVSAVAVTPDGRCAVSGSSDETLKVWDLETGRQVRSLEGHTAWVSAVAVTPDGRRVVSGSDDETLKVWDLETGRQVRSLNGHAGKVQAVAVTPDGRRAVSGSRDETLRVWDLDTGREVRSLNGHAGEVHAVAVTPDGRSAVSGAISGYGDETLKVWDLETGREVRSLEGHADWVYSVAVTPDGRRAVSGSRDNTLKVWDLETGRQVRSIEGHAGEVYAVVVTPDGRRAVSDALDELSHYHILKVWDLETGKELKSFEGHTSWVHAMPVTPDGRWCVVYGSDDNTLKVWDLKTGKELRSLKGHTSRVNALAVTPDGRCAVSGSDDETLKVWDLETGRQVRSLEGHTAWVSAVAVTPDGRCVVSGSDDNTLKVWDLKTGGVLASFWGDSGILACAVSPDGKTIVAGEVSGRLHFLRLEGCEE